MYKQNIRRLNDRYIKYEYHGYGIVYALVMSPT